MELRMSWDALADELRNDPALVVLDEVAVKAVIDLLALVVQADGKVGVLEQSEFEDQIDSMPFLAGKDVGPALTRAKGVQGEAAVRTAVSQSVARLPKAGPMEKIYRMAAVLAWTDLNLHRDESTVLRCIAESLGISAATAASIDATVR
jgi:uncharacterized tellurite resistance protein B-like protein